MLPKCQGVIKYVLLFYLVCLIFPMLFSVYRGNNIFFLGTLLFFWCDYQVAMSAIFKSELKYGKVINDLLYYGGLGLILHSVL